MNYQQPLKIIQNIMQVIINRTTRNELYTEGTLTINDRRTTHTVEATQSMLPAGSYTLKIVKLSERKQKLYLFSQGKRTPVTLSTCNSWLACHKKLAIAIGEPLIPGIVYKSTPVYDRLIDRLTKCQDDKCKANEPIRHWLSEIRIKKLVPCEQSPK